MALKELSMDLRSIGSGSLKTMVVRPHRTGELCIGIRSSVRKLADRFTSPLAY
jgi:hypothetical protein